jgi:hypothetical protein
MTPAPEAQCKVIVVNDPLGSLFFERADGDQSRCGLEQRGVPGLGALPLSCIEQSSLSDQPEMKLWVELGGHHFQPSTLAARSSRHPDVVRATGRAH